MSVGNWEMSCSVSTTRAGWLVLSTNSLYVTRSLLLIYPVKSNSRINEPVLIVLLITLSGEADAQDAIPKMVIAHIFCSCAEYRTPCVGSQGKLILTLPLKGRSL